MGSGMPRVELRRRCWTVPPETPLCALRGSAGNRQEQSRAIVPPLRGSFFVFVSGMGVNDRVCSGEARFPVSVLPGGMKDGGNNYGAGLFIDSIHDPVGEAIWIAPTYVLGWMASASKEGIVSQCLQTAHDGDTKLFAQSRLVRVVPRRCPDDVRLHFGTEDNPPTHALASRRRRISSRGTDEAGSCACAASRALTSRSSSRLKGASSNLIARRTTSWRCSGVSVGS